MLRGLRRYILAKSLSDVPSTGPLGMRARTGRRRTAEDEAPVELSYLEVHRHSDAYRGRLDRASGAFADWLARNRSHVQLADLIRDTPALNQILVEFIDACFHANVSSWVPKHATLGLQNAFPHLRGQLTRAWDALRSWRLRTGPRSRIPLLLEVLIAICMCCLDVGLANPGRALQYVTASVLLGIGFFGLF